jgi:hypothetical protein
LGSAAPDGEASAEIELSVKEMTLVDRSLQTETAKS